MIINGRSLYHRSPIIGMIKTKERAFGVSYGLTECGYDIRLAQDVQFRPWRRFVLSYSMEEFNMPNDLMGRVLNKSTWARIGVDASMTTNVEPGWRGFLTLELRYSGWKSLHIPAGSGIAQVIFETIQNPVVYEGKYQNQQRGVTPARFEDTLLQTF